MSRSFLCIVMQVLLIMGMLAFMYKISPAEASLSVHNLNTGLDYSTIQEAIYAHETLDGHEIFVESGIYYENVVVNKTLTLTGENREYTIIDGNYTGNIVTVASDDVNITNFTIQNSGSFYIYKAGIQIDYYKRTTVAGNILKNNLYGIGLRARAYFHERSHCKIVGNNITDNGCGIQILYSSNNTISGNNITDNDDYGIQLHSSFNNTISGNNITNNGDGIDHSKSSSNIISGNRITKNNGSGIYLYRSSKNMLSNNVFSDNTYNFFIYSWESAHFINDMDDSNTVNDKPVYYWVNRQDMTVPLDGGYVALINCTRITVQNLNLTNNGQGILVVSTTNSIITKNNIAFNHYGIDLSISSGNTISENNITDNEEGILIRDSTQQNITGNLLNENQYGFTITGYELDEYLHYITKTNLVNNKPVYYLVNEEGLEINSSTHPEVGFLALINSTNITVKNRVQTQMSTSVGLLLAYTNQSKIINNTISGNLDGIYILTCHDNIISGNTLKTNLDSGVTLYSSSNNIIVGNTGSINLKGFSNYNSLIKNNGSIYLDHSDSNSIVENVDFIHLSDSSNNNSIVGNSGKVDLEDSSNNSIYGNTGSVHLFNSSNNDIVGNTGGAIFSEWFSSGNSIIGNNYSWIGLGRSSASIIENNCSSISLFRSGADIMGNTVIANNGTGIYLDWYTWACSIAGNIIVANNGIGIHLNLPSADYNDIVGNTVTANNGTGIYIHVCENNLITGNIITANNGTGIHLFVSSGNHIIGNTVTAHNGIGVHLDQCGCKGICHNNFVNTNKQIIRSGTFFNTWDNDCEGNYWSDYNGIDSDGDGIGDTPYIIDGNNTDRYPLMNFYWNPCDINHDLIVNMSDAYSAARAFGTQPNDERWNCHADITGPVSIEFENWWDRMRAHAEPDNLVDMRDIGLIVRNFGETYA